jgi:mRNA-degrading endonuclease RelE of RelBE toxin-antitoxin system
MNYEVILTADFKKYFKRLFKKYPSLKDDLLKLIQKLELDYKIGIALGSNLFKIRLLIESKKKGKSGGARIIYYFLSPKNEIYLILGSFSVLNEYRIYNSHFLNSCRYIHFR